MDKHPSKHQLHPILQLGDPGLRVSCKPVTDFEDRTYCSDGERLLFILEQFRAEFGFGRAISAPQIGIARRMVAMNLGEGPFLVVNPEITWKSEKSFTMWDDCMSFPFLLVRLARAESLALDWQEGDGNHCTWEEVDRSRSELIQHEVDHLDGILSVDLALGRDALVARGVYDADRGRFNGMVDYEISAIVAQSY
ncbi:MAG: peptide deformylase [Candidatus Latescibacteria bacterium]|nr:peptide deformylase [Candidatus Latescibacterota bacterium]